jgi:hypothetical protein
VQSKKKNEKRKVVSDARYDHVLSFHMIMFSPWLFALPRPDHKPAVDVYGEGGAL